MKQVKVKLRLLVSLMVVLISVSGCVPSGGGNDELSPSESGPQPVFTPGGSVTPGGGVTPSGLTAEQAFAVALHPIIQSDSKTCKNCHRAGVGFAPFFAESVVASAWTAINTTSKINLAAPSSSRIVAKVRDTNHNCSAAGCASDAADFEAAVVNMTILMQSPAAPNSDPTPGASTVPGLDSLNAFDQSGLRNTVMACASCHGDAGAQIPFAVSNLQNAHDAIIGLVDLSGPNNSGNSFIVQTIRSGHQGFGSAVADQLEADVRLWWGLMQPQTVNEVPVNTGRLFSGQVPIPDNSVDVNDPGMIYMEAEAGQLAAPFVVAAMGGSTGITTPNNGQNAAANNTNSRAIYTFNIEQAGEYKILGRYIAASDGDNSFHWRVDNNAFQSWGIPISTEHAWDAFNNGGGDANAADSTVQLAAGMHTLEIRQREDGTYLDQILITNQLNFVPGGSGDTSEAYVLEFDISQMSGVPGALFRFTIRSFDSLSYVVSEPTIVAPVPMQIRNVMLHVNNIYNPNDSTFTIIDQSVPAGETMLAPYSMILLKGQTPPLDMFSVSFEAVQAN